MRLWHDGEILLREIMEQSRVRRSAVVLILIAAILLISDPLSAAAQCALCKSAASGLDSAAARNLNLAVLLLLTPPVTIFCAFFYVAYKHRHPPEDEP